MNKVSAVVRFVALCAWTLACGGVDLEDDSADQDIGSVEQTMIAKNSPQFQMGSQTGGNHNRCTKTSAGQVCQVPTTKNIAWDVTNSDFQTVPDAAADAIKVINGFKSQLGAGWTFTQKTDCCSGRNISIIAVSDACGSGGSASNDINNYSCVSWSAPTSMTEGAGVVGNYQNSAACTVFVDTGALAAKGATATADGFLFRHAIAHGVATCLGMGNRTDAPVPIATRSDMNVGVERSALTTGEVCVLQSFNQTATPGSFGLTTPACTND